MSRGEAGDAPVRAPELSGAVAWINVEQPLSLQALRGKVVLLDFWTYGCINCVHVLPDLKRLEKKYARELVVIGVHSGKFENEKKTEHLRRIVQRYEIQHPVANDAEFRIWRAYTVRAWPTQVLIDPAGYIVGAASGEGHAEQFDRAIAAVIQVFDERGELDRRPLPQVIEQAPVVRGPLMFPGKVLAVARRDGGRAAAARDDSRRDARGDAGGSSAGDSGGGRLFIADSNHHRILVCTLPDDATAAPRARVLDVVGTGEAGRANGPFDRATFNKPQGLALAGDTLFVADTENHLLRAIDLAARVVTDAAGTGRQARQPGDGGSAGATDLNSPWDLAAHGPLLFIAMAGSHQIWMLDTTRGLVWPYAGSGREARLDGTVDEAAFAQPSGLALIGSASSSVASMLVADSEANIIRAIDLPPVNRVRTLAGGDLFDFGDVDGVGDAVRLQHPLGVASHDGVVYIADTYNHRIKQLDPQTGRVHAFAGSGRPGHEDGPAATAQFYEPGGLTVAGGHLYVADTNNHAVRRVDLRTGQVATIELDAPATAAGTA